MKKYLIFLCLLFIVSKVSSATYALNTSHENDTVFFESDAKLEFIKGITNLIDGSFFFDVEKPTDSIYGLMQVDLNSLKTSIETRDKHMREEYLETDKFQYAYFELISVDNMPTNIKMDSLYTIDGNGYFYLHGVQNSLQPKLTFKAVSEGENGQIDVTAEFQILLEDYDIERPQLVLLKVAKQINIKIFFQAFQVETFQAITVPSIYK